MKRFLTLLLAVFMFTGCDGFANKDNIMNLLSSPKLSQRENRIVSCIKDYLGQDVILKYPILFSSILDFTELNRIFSLIDKKVLYIVAF